MNNDNLSQPNSVPGISARIPQYVFAVAFLTLVLLTSFLTAHGQQGMPFQGHPSTAPPIPRGIIGIAVYITADRVGDPAGLFIRAAHPAGPASQAGLRHGQEIIAVDGVALTGKTYQEVIVMIRGEAGQPVRLTIQEPGSTREVSIIRVIEDVLFDDRDT